MQLCILEEIATDSNFREDVYLSANPDVAKAVRDGIFKSGRQHFDKFGKLEGRRIRRNSSAIRKIKEEKLRRIRPLLRTDDMPYTEHTDYYDFLTDDLRRRFDISNTEAVSSHSYDKRVQEIIDKNDVDFVIDIGAGRRQVYYERVVNFEIVPYDTTDVLGVGEDLPFKDGSFSAAISIAVLEHVKDPFRCAKEIVRILKPGGLLICCVPFLQPFHSYPHHYYNMTYEGLRNLFNETLTIDTIEVTESLLPIWSLTWILQSWADGLTGTAREAFENLRVKDLMGNAQHYLEHDFVKNLPPEKNRELASAFLLCAHKPL
jgi:SAM-dependent methyltransferase